MQDGVELSERAFRVEREPEGNAKYSGPRAMAAFDLAAGGSVAVAAFGLREVGVIVGPIAVVVAVGCFLLGPGPPRYANRFLLAFPIVFGWLPLLGWVPGLETALDVPGLALATWAGVTCAHRLRRRHALQIRRRTFTITDVAALLAGGAVALWWGVPFARLGLDGRLTAFMGGTTSQTFYGWDNVAHFWMFRANLQLGSFISVRSSAPQGGALYGSGYPQGIHQAWSQLVHLWIPHPPTNPHWLLNTYSVMLMLTVGLTVSLVCTAIARLCGRDVLVSLPAMAAVVGLYAFGVLWPLNGEPNFGLAIAAVATAALLFLRPTLSPTHMLTAVSGFALIAAYNWFPMVVIVGPAVWVATVHLWRRTSVRNRGLSLTLGAAIAFALLAPALLFAPQGIGALTNVGGVNEAPWALLITGVAALAGVVLVRQSLQPDLATNVVLGTAAVIGGPMVAFLVIYEINSTGTVPYYGQKLAIGVTAICVLILAGMLVSYVTTSTWRHRLPSQRVTLAAVLATLASLQLYGYVGPSAGALFPPAAGAGAPGVARGFESHQVSFARVHPFADAASVLMAASFASHEITGHRKNPGRWEYVIPSLFPGYGEAAVWFAVLRGDITQGEVERLYNSSSRLGHALDLQVVHPLGGISTSVAVDAVARKFPDPTTELHLIVPPWLATALIHHDRHWATPGVLYTTNRI